ncbi:MAG: hypothetical protein ACM35G_03305 [Planctomycetaceae bacterium]
MRDVVFPMVVLALGALRAAGQEPLPGAVPPTPAASGPPPPPLPVEPREPGQVPGQPTFGPAFEIVPAHRLAMMEAGQALPANDPRVASAARRLERLTAGYVEDAPRIAELTFRVCGQIRAANRPATPSHMLDGALHWSRPATLPPAAPRQFERYAALYRQARVVKGLDHAAAISALSP